MDEIETKLLKGCGTSDAIPYEDDYVCCGHLEEGGEVLICKECEGKIIQHRETKKWIEGMIDKNCYCNTHDGTFYSKTKNGKQFCAFCWLKKQISGAVK
jgi:hypothetical protein